MIEACRLWERTSAKSGRRYWAGALGGLRILVFENAERNSDDDPALVVFFDQRRDRRPAADDVRERISRAGKAGLGKAPAAPAPTDPETPF